MLLAPPLPFFNTASVTGAWSKLALEKAAKPQVALLPSKVKVVNERVSQLGHSQAIYSVLVLLMGSEILHCLHTTTCAALANREKSEMSLSCCGDLP